MRDMSVFEVHHDAMMARCIISHVFGERLPLKQRYIKSSLSKFYMHDLSIVLTWDIGNKIILESHIRN